jgi:hypothetical protein
MPYGSRSDMIRQAPPDETAPMLEWDDFRTYVLDWRQDQHLAAIGPTGQGKSVAIHGLLDSYRKYVAYLATKPKDATLDAYTASGGYQRVQDWPPTRGRVFKRRVSAEDMPRRLVWPDATQLNSEARQKAVFGRALDDIYVEGGWCTVFDDWWYLGQILGLEKAGKKFLMNARSNDIPFVLGAQRPAGNRLVEIFDQAEHLLFFRDNDEQNLKRIGGVGWLDSGLIRAHVAHLEPYQFLYTNTRSGHMYRSRAPELSHAA